ncbi:hypothetical protein ACYOEI_24605 [Singulisphaera rosea]
MHSSIDPLIIPIFAMSIPIIIVPISLWMKHRRFVRELEHRERIRAMELGRNHLGDESWWSAPRISVALGVFQPLGLFVLAWAASEEMRGMGELIWFTSMIVAGMGVLGGTTIAWVHFSRLANRANSQGYTFTKPEFDADAFDVVSSRG